MVTPAPISIVLPAHNQLDYCRACIASLRRCTPEPHRLILVDNGSTDGVGAYFDSVAGATVVHSPENLGFAAGVNLGIARAEGHVLLLNSDTLLTPGWLARLTRALHATVPGAPNTALVGPVTNCAPGPQQLDGLHLQTEAEIDAFAMRLARDCAGRVRSVNRLVGFCLLIHAQALAELGTLDERFGLGNFEDDDYCTRARRAGYGLVIAEDCFVYHHGGRTFAGMGLEGAAFQELLETNRRRYAEKWEVHVPAPPDPAERVARLRRQAADARARGNAQEAMAILRQAIEAAPNDAVAYAELAQVLQEAGRASLAREFARQALRHDPAQALAQTLLGEARLLDLPEH